MRMNCVSILQMTVLTVIDSFAEFLLIIKLVL